MMYSSPKNSYVTAAAKKKPKDAKHCAIQSIHIEWADNGFTVSVHKEQDKERMGMYVEPEKKVFESAKAMLAYVAECCAEHKEKKA